MTVVLDVDETITAAPAFFAWLSAALRRDGHQVVILTVRRDRADTARELERLGVVYDRLEVPHWASMRRWPGRSPALGSCGPT